MATYLNVLGIAPVIRRMLQMGACEVEDLANPR
jgi:hypothetical protein